MTKTLLVLLALLLPMVATAAPPVEGIDYVVIDDGQPYAPHPPGQVEVAEVFAWWCPHCFAFQPALEAWKASLPRDVRFTYVPAVFTDDAFARAWFAALDAGALPRLHQALYAAVHVDGTLARNATVDELAVWFGAHGLVPEKMRAALLAPATDRRLQAARDFALRSGVDGTPTLVVDGRYRVTGTSREATLRIARALVDQLRTH
ncbi:MAG: thiol:disulfide interchange protein DsbA/DsbL [Lysobacteraceae bacterium]